MSSITARTYLTPEEYIAEDILSLISIGAELPLNQIYRFVLGETNDT